MDYAILPFKTAKFLRLLRKAQIDQSRMVSYDGIFVISTFRIGNQPVKRREILEIDPVDAVELA